MGGGAVDLGIPGLGPATPLARGGFAQVYRAEQLSLRRAVAVKVLFAPPADKIAFARFERECHTLGAVSDHPNIVVVHDRGVTADGRPFIIMELRAGGSLADRLTDDGPLAPGEARDVGIKICDALAVAHEAGVIHRDVKPANILLSAYGEPALADFGIARIDGGHKTATGEISASAAHAAREVLAGEEPSAQSDVYSMGSTLLQLLTGRTPFQRPGDATVWQLINRAMTESAPNPAALGVPESYAAVIACALDHDLGVRYPSARTLQAALRELSSLDGTAATPPSRAATGQGDGGGAGTGGDTIVDLPGPAHPLSTVGLAPAWSGTDAPPTIPTAAVEAGAPAETSVEAGAGDVGDGADQPLRRRRGTRWLLRALLVVLVGAGAAALALGPGADLLTGPEPPSPRLEFPQASIEPLTAGSVYALTVVDAPEGSTFRLVVDGQSIEDEPGPLSPYRAEPGRHELAIEVSRPDGASTTTDPVDLYVSPGPPQGGLRVNLASVPVAPENWPTALREFDELVADGHTELVLSVGGTGEFWNFYIDGYGDDRDAAWAYCARFELGPDDCYAAVVPIEEQG